MIFLPQLAILRYLFLELGIAAWLFQHCTTFIKTRLLLFYFSSSAAATRVNFVEDYRFMPLPEEKIQRCRIKRRIAIESEYINVIGRGVINDLGYCIPSLPTQGAGLDVFVDVSTKELEAFFYCCALDVPFTDKGIQACRLKESTEASGQSVVCRHTRAF